MTRVYRTDAGVQLRQMRKDANGDLIVDATVARVGVYEYPQPDGSVRRELVRPQELFDPRSIATLRGRPVTDQHPAVMFANADVPPPSCGVVGQVRQDGRYLVATSRVAAGTALARKVETSRQRETSPGYFMDLHETPGVWVHPEFAPEPGERYDAVQGIRDYDHLAVVPVGRCAGSCGGEECRCEIRTDAGPGAAANGESMPTQKKPQDARTDAPSKMAMELVMKAYPDDVKGALAAYAALMAEMGGEAPAAPVVDAEKPPGEMPPAMAAKPEEKMDAGKAPATSPVVEQQKRIDSLEATVKAQAAQLEAMGKQATKDRATSGVTSLVAEWRGALGARYDAAGKTPDAVRRDALKAFYPAESEDLDKADDRTLEIRCDLARRYDPSVQAVLAGHGGGMHVGHVDGAGAPGGEDPIALSERKLRDRFANGKA